MSDEIGIPKKSEAVDFERPRLDDSFHLENENPIGYGVGEDGLPKPKVLVTFKDTVSPKLTQERLVCMEAPGRKQCRHYRRMLVPASSDVDRTVCVRLCTADRDSDGQYKSLNDQEVLACELRDPQDLFTKSLIDKFDAELMQRQAEQKEEEDFDPIAALEAEKK
jgi:hypothetical protein